MRATRMGSLIPSSYTRVILLLTLFLFSHFNPTFAFPHNPRNIANANATTGRSRTSLNSGWRFHRFPTTPDNLIYDNVRTDISDPSLQVLKPWILPSANDFMADSTKHYAIPANKAPGAGVQYAQKAFNDSAWEELDLPHDWAIKGPFYEGEKPVVGGGMGRLPSFGVGWYRRSLVVEGSDAEKIIYLDIDGAMSYAAVWVNGEMVGGWPYGYNSFRLDITRFLKFGNGEENLIAVRVDNPKESSRWYPGGGIYRNVWVTKVEKVHVGLWGTYVRSRNVSSAIAIVELETRVENKGNGTGKIEMVTDIHTLDTGTGRAGRKIAESLRAGIAIPAGEKKEVKSTFTVRNPLLWGPPPTQNPNMYIAVTRLYTNDSDTPIDTYQTPFGLRTFTYSGTKGLLINGEHVSIRGVNQHHDLGALGGAWNHRAAERQLETLRELGVNAIRMSHNPPAPEFLDLTDRMGFIVMNEIFDCWEAKKTNNDFHLIFPDWHEPDLRSFIRRDRNHASIYAWSFGNEVGEQTTGEAGAAIAKRLNDIVGEEDPTRPSTASMNVAKPDQPFPKALDILSLNYQGEGIRDTPQYSHTSGTRTPPLYDAMHKAFPDKLLHSSETAAALSSRGTYIFPATPLSSAPVNDTSGGNSTFHYVSAYELHTADFGSSAEKVFAALDAHPFVAGEFVWSGWDYLGEPTPYYSSRSSYFGIIDLAGFKKDRWYLYQARWRPDIKFAHILPHWNWPNRVGEVTPIHVFSSANEAECWVNGVSQGRRKRVPGGYRFRWDDVVYQPGEVTVQTWKDGKEWANKTIRTTGPASKIHLQPDRRVISADGYDLSFITCEVKDQRGSVVPDAGNEIEFKVQGGEIVATDNGDPTDMRSFSSQERRAFGGFALVVVRAKKGRKGEIVVDARAVGVEGARVVVRAE